MKGTVVLDEDGRRKRREGKKQLQGGKCNMTRVTMIMLMLMIPIF